MACIHGRINPSNNTKLRLFSTSGGYCQNPSCLTLLFPEELSGHIHIAEMAHIIAAMSGGPRANDIASNSDLCHYDNLILLCPTCHTMIDKAPDVYTENMIVDWKNDHVARLRRTFEVAQVDSRPAVRALIEPFLTTNRDLFDRYGPHNEYAWNLESEGAGIWSRKMRGQIIPNNQRILLVADVNCHLLAEAERLVVEEFRQHVDDLVQKHIDGVETVATQFPIAMSDLYQ